MIIRGSRQRDQNRRSSRRFDFSDCGGPRSGDDEIRSRVLLVKIVKECANVGLESGRRIGLLNLGNLLSARLVNEADRIPHVLQETQALFDCFINGLRSLASAKNEDLKRWIVRLGTDCLELRAYRVSGNDGAASEIAGRLRIGDGCIRDPSRE